MKNTFKFFLPTSPVNKNVRSHWLRFFLPTSPVNVNVPSHWLRFFLPTSPVNVNVPSHWLRFPRKNAFTLAEVLITLGIIGVVAAMTLSSLIGSYKRKETSVRLKKFYSTMKQMEITATNEHGEVNGWDTSLPYEQFLLKYFAPYLTHYRVEGNTIIFTDGTLMTLYKGSCMDLLYDTNGKRKPNKEGYDRFRFLICEKNAGWCGSEGFCSYRPTSKKSDREFLKQGCLTNKPGYAGLTCSALLEYDGWEFKDDYPLNKR